MRIDHLELLRYGKFTDVSVALPQAKRDFHLVVGPNEAGKSTIRDAILDLLFGIETRTQYDFLHPKAEMRLGGKLTHNGISLDFQRIKKARALLDTKGSPLQDNVLLPFIGTADRSFFDQMFGLDHDRLVAGGDEILNASNDIGRILFQSAAGVGSLGTVRDALEAEADRLWAPRKSGERAYYVAATALATAEATLKQVTVKTKEWSTARENVSELEKALSNVKETFRRLDAERARLERIRRVAPSLRIFADNTRAMNEMGNVVTFPNDAADLLKQTDTRVAASRIQLELSNKFLEEKRIEIAGISVSEDFLRNRDLIQALAERRQQTRFHERDIEKCTTEIGTLLANVQDCARQLGWPQQNETDLALKLPSLPVRKTLESLIKKHGAIEQSLASAVEAERVKRLDIARNEAELEQQPVMEVSPELTASLDSALKLGDYIAATKRENDKIIKANQQLQNARAALGEWQCETEKLRATPLPPDDLIAKLKGDFDYLLTEERTLQSKKKDLKQEIEASDLGISQHKASHHPVTIADLLEAREKRDGKWQDIREGAISIRDSAATFEESIKETDHLADQRHDKAREVAELQSKIDNAQRLRLQLENTEHRLLEISVDLERINAAWLTHATKLGFPQMPFLAFAQWKQSLEKLVSASDALVLAETDAKHIELIFETAKNRLRAALGALAEKLAENADISVLIETAAVFAKTATANKARRAELERQIGTARQGLVELSEKLARASADHDSWLKAWDKSTSEAELTHKDIASVEGALLLFENIEKNLKAIQDLRKTRIEPMQQDLAAFTEDALKLAPLINVDISEVGAPGVSIELSNRLAIEVDNMAKVNRLENEAQRFENQCRDANSEMAIAVAKIAPLTRIAETTDAEQLRILVGRSDEYRDKKNLSESARAFVDANGDGRTLEQLAEEVTEVDISTIPTRLDALTRELDEARNEQASISASLATAMAELNKIGGQDVAARAESSRQEALSRMGDAAERFIKVHVAGKLLRWAIDRFRETKQGPMLSRASEIFSDLTLGSYSKLIVDFESDPPTLEGRRADGRIVGVAGMSDGTRDQLYLALRLAALEMHISQGHALPFIADDLFINYDDERASAGLSALAKLSEITQVIFLSHHKHLIPAIKKVFGDSANIISLAA